MTGSGLCVGLVGPVPPPDGGMAGQTRQLVSLLRLEGVKVTQLVTNSPYWPRAIGRVRGVRAIFRLLPYIFRAWRLAGQVDVIHIMANSGWSWQLFCAPVVWLAAWRGTPVVVNYRGGEALPYFQRSFSRVAPTLNKASEVIVPSAYLEEVFRGFGAKTSIIPNIIDVSRFTPGSDSVRSGFHLIITRNLEPIYGIDTAIRAIAHIRDQVEGVRLAIAGSGPQLHELQALVSELKLDEEVSFVGRINSEAIPLFYQNADVMLNPTTVDNMPNSVLEALACGVAVVSTNVGGVPYIVEDEVTALLVDRGDDKRMAQAILRLYRDEPLRRRLIENGIAEVQQYTWLRVREQWLSLYMSLIKKKPL